MRSTVYVRVWPTVVEELPTVALSDKLQVAASEDVEEVADNHVSEVSEIGRIARYDAQYVDEWR